jgi:hypothetical protein
MRKLIAAIALALLAGACHPGTSVNDGSTVIGLGPLYADDCDIRWNEWPGGNVGWLQDSSGSLDGCTYHQTCVIYQDPAIPSGNGNLLDEACFPLFTPPYFTAGQNATAPGGFESLDAFVEFGTLSLDGLESFDTRCYLFLTDDNIDPTNVCPPGLPYPPLGPASVLAGDVAMSTADPGELTPTN